MKGPPTNSGRNSSASIRCRSRAFCPSFWGFTPQVALVQRLSTLDDEDLGEPPPEGPNPMTAYVQLATEMEDLGLVPEGDAGARAQAYATESGRTVWARDEFTDEPLYSVEPAVGLAKSLRKPIEFCA
jgi:hypothetical protein